MRIQSILTLALLLSTCFLLIFISCGDDDQTITPDPGEEEEPPVVSGPPNILLIIADDMGLDATNGYPEGTDKPNTPHLDSLLNNGLRFTNMWVNPTCSPTRASIITGKYGHFTGVLTAGDRLSNSELVLQSYINQNSDTDYANAIVGKWHLAGANRNFDPERLGIDYYAGMVSGTAASYYGWDFTENGTVITETQYITEKFTDLAIDWLGAQSDPWFLWLAYNAPHTPFHLPPAVMHSQGALPDDAATINANPMPYYLAAIEAMDYQIGRVMDQLSAEEKGNTYVIFVGDNGTPGQVSQAPYGRNRSKGSIYQGGINVPMLVTGPAVATGSSDALVNGVDLFTTIANLAGTSDQNVNNSQSFAPLLTGTGSAGRNYVYSEYRTDDDGVNWCIRDGQYKLIINGDGTEEFYDLAADPYENDPLADSELNATERAAKEDLVAEGERIRQ